MIEFRQERLAEGLGGRRRVQEGAGGYWRAAVGIGGCGEAEEGARRCRRVLEGAGERGRAQEGRWREGGANGGWSGGSRATNCDNSINFPPKLTSLAKHSLGSIEFNLPRSSLLVRDFSLNKRPNLLDEHIMATQTLRRANSIQIGRANVRRTRVDSQWTRKKPPRIESVRLAATKRHLSAAGVRHLGWEARR